MFNVLESKKTFLIIWKEFVRIFKEDVQKFDKHSSLVSTFRFPSSIGLSPRLNRSLTGARFSSSSSVPPCCQNSRYRSVSRPAAGILPESTLIICVHRKSWWKNMRKLEIAERHEGEKKLDWLVKRLEKHTSSGQLSQWQNRAKRLWENKWVEKELETIRDHWKTLEGAIVENTHGNLWTGSGIAILRHAHFVHCQNRHCSKMHKFRFLIF